MPTDAPPRRPLHPMERAWLVAERLLPGFVISLVVEGEGALDPTALAAALPLHPGMAGRVVGSLGFSEVVCDRPPRLAEAPGVLDPLRGPSAEIVLRPGRLTFRAHHAVADGRAIQRWAEDTFAALRGEPLLPVGFQTPPPATPGPPLPHDQPSLFGPPDPAAPWGSHTAHLRIDCSPRRPLQRVLSLLWERRPGGRVSVPVDLRAPNTSAYGNLTGISPVSGPEDLSTVRARACQVFTQAEQLRWLPLSLLAAGARSNARRAIREDRFDAIATVSNLGKVDLEKLSTPSFRARHAWWIPPENMGNPLLILISGDEGGLDLSAAAPHAVVSPTGLAGFLDELGAALRRT